MAEMGQRRRLDSRFPLRENVRFRQKGSDRLIESVTRDISARGLFIVHASRSIWPGAELELHLPCAEGRVALVQARVTHVVRSPAHAVGAEPGLGVQFENLSADQADDIAALVKRAQANDARCRIPRLASVSERRPEQLDPIHEYVLKFIDGAKPPEELAHLTGMDVDAVVEELHDLRQLGVIELVSPDRGDREGLGNVDESEPDLDRFCARTSIRAKSLRAPLAESGCSALVDTTATAMAQRDDYAVLGVARTATPEQIRTAFVTRYSHFDADNADEQRLGVYGQALEVIRQRLVDAHATLCSASARAEYDEYRSCCDVLTKFDAGKSALSHEELGTLWERRARYEEKRRDHAAAANSWCRLYELRPLDLQCIQKAASLILEAKLGVRRALALAQQAVELAPTEPYNHRLLARVYLESGLRMRARKELQKAVELERGGDKRTATSA